MMRFSASALRLTLDDKGIKKMAFFKDGSWHDIQPPEIFRIVAPEARISNVKEVKYFPLEEKIAIAEKVKEKIRPRMVLPAGEVELSGDFDCIQGSALVKEVVRRREEEAEWGSAKLWKVVAEETERSAPYLLCKERWREEEEWRRYRSLA